MLLASLEMKFVPSRGESTPACTSAQPKHFIRPDNINGVRIVDERLRESVRLFDNEKGRRAAQQSEDLGGQALERIAETPERIASAGEEGVGIPERKIPSGTEENDPPARPYDANDFGEHSRGVHGVLERVGGDCRVKGSIREGEGFGVRTREMKAGTAGAPQAALRDIGAEVFAALEKRNAIGRASAGHVQNAASLRDK